MHSVYGKQDLPPPSLVEKIASSMPKFASEMTSEMLVLVARRVEGEVNYIRLCTSALLPLTG